MKLKLKENPNEWRKFTLVWCVMIPLLAFLLSRQRIVSPELFKAILGVGMVIGLLALVMPKLFRGFYRTGMTVSFYVGQFTGKVILTVVFVFAVIPLGFLLRLMGKDLLELKKLPNKATYWKPARRTGTFDQQF